MSPLSLNRHTEKEMVALCLQGDRMSCKELFEQHSGKLMALCYRFARDSNEAQDMLQEGFIRIFNKLDLYSGEGSLEAWMRRVMINTALKYRQKHIGKHESVPLCRLWSLGRQSIQRVPSAMPPGLAVSAAMPPSSSAIYPTGSY